MAARHILYTNAPFPPPRIESLRGRVGKFDQENAIAGVLGLHFRFRQIELVAITYRFRKSEK